MAPFAIERLSRLVSPRLVSLIDQAIWSLVNFAHVWLVAVATTYHSLSEYVISFSFCLLAIRVHAALVAMPLATQYGVGVVPRHLIIAQYHVFNDKVLVVLPVVMMMVYGVAHAAFGSQIAPLGTPVVVAATASLVMLSEHLRRVLLLRGRLPLLVGFDVGCGLLTFAGVWMAVHFGLTGAWILSGFFAPGLFSGCVYVWLRHSRRSVRGPPASLRNQLVSQSPLLINNLAQWATGQSAYFLTAALLSSREVAVVAILRNLFGPLNLVLLSLEGVLPKLFGAAISTGGVASLRATMVKELGYASLGFVAFSAAIIWAGPAVVGLLYGEGNAALVNTTYLLGFAATYWLAVLSRIVTVALRARGDVASLGKVALIGLCAFVVTGAGLALGFGVAGIIFAMVLVEAVILALFSLHFLNTAQHAC